MMSPVALFLPLSTPPQRSNAHQWRRRRICLIIQALKSGQRGEDDYHSTLKALNSRSRIVPRKSLGQHYMLNSSINEQLSGVAGVAEGDVVLEIGPGTGSLTNVLINAGATVVAVEKVLQEDITRCHFRSYVSSLLETVDTRGVVKYAKVVSNLPFNISTAVVKQLLPMGDLFSDVIILLQDETALRLTKFQLHSSDYRPINLFVNFYSDAEYICKVERTNFFPQPNVDAAVVKFKLKQKSEYPQVTSANSFFSMVNSAFSGKRKMLRKSLQHICMAQKIEDALRTVGLQATARPQELTLEDFVRLHNLICTSNPMKE
ncbi:ribosomal RNA small subunit methyltransferase, chloroplastic isoform X2 [Phalaenopsis equestris]|uniref:ribosomal RNA small subunit methyltransferase, chloroplastic isoform X2 n=1 Tax=Phalaenopsis equestris TaxID=78828 RepID=UPI0009E3E733|nr:ribosomal RNA small subunit methyltransferase, chloroplastic isoform X2 [Phalaenopsis equestris]